jgi:hypothetical protein
MYTSATEALFRSYGVIRPTGRHHCKMIGSATEMTDLPFKMPLKTYARMGGVLYLAIIVLGLFGETFIRGRLIVSGDPAATAANIKSMELLWRIGIAAEFFLLLCAVTLTWIFYVLLRPVSGDLALLAVFFNLVSMGLEAVIQLSFVAALFPLANAGYLKVFTPEQLYAMSQLSARLYGYGFSCSLIFFAGYCVVMGYLIFRSGYLPRTLGCLLQIAGLCYLTNSFALLLAPDFQNQIFPAILAPAFIGELSLALWLSMKGVDVTKWQEKAKPLGLQVP